MRFNYKNKNYIIIAAKSGELKNVQTLFEKVNDSYNIV